MSEQLPDLYVSISFAMYPDYANTTLAFLESNKEYDVRYTPHAKLKEAEDKANDYEQRWIAGNTIILSTTAQLKSAEHLLSLYRLKRSIDGCNDREWDAGKHLDCENEIARLEDINHE